MALYKTDVIQPLMDNKDAEIIILKTELIQTSKTAKWLETKVNKLTQVLNALEQYGRRQNIRLNNDPLADTAKCEEVVLNILNNALPLSTEAIRTDDISRCHPIGKPNKKNNRQYSSNSPPIKQKPKLMKPDSICQIST